MDIKGKVSRDALDDARIERERKMNPPEVEPGMGDWEDSSMSGNDDFGWGSPSNDTSSGWGDSTGDGWGDSAGGSGWGDQSGGWGGGGGLDAFGQTNNGKEEKEFEDKVFDGLAVGAKGATSFIKAFVDSFSTFDYMTQMRFGRASAITGGITAVAGGIVTLFGLDGFGVLLGGLLATGVAVPVFMWGYDEFSKNGAPDDNMDVQGDNFSDMGFASGFDDEPFDNSEFSSTDGFDSEDEFSMDMDSDEEDDDEFSAFDDFDFDEEENTVLDSKDILSKREGIIDDLDSNNGMLTRRYLYDKISDALVNVNSKYNHVKVISDTSDEFDAWDALVQSSASILQPKGDNVDIPYLLSVKDKLFYTLLEVKRVNWIKNVDLFVNEIVNICRFDAETGTDNTKIYGIGTTVGDRIYIKIMKGTTTMVSIKDIYRDVEKEILDSGNYMPIVLGLDVEGNPVVRDFKKLDSILVTGMPRSGKTWLVQSVLTQMTFYLKPSELEIRVLDPKDQISDYRSMKMPHIRKFVSTDAGILSELRDVVKVEGVRRKKLIGEGGFVNIFDFKKKNPDVHLPLLYVVIDEVITLAERMDKDTKAEFQGLLTELVSQLPALGIRIFMIPHVVKDNILKKTITDLIPCRVSVKGDTQHIESSTGTKNFKHKLTHQGDMAVNLGEGESIFIHSAVLTDTNEGNQDLFDFLNKFWSKLEPESIKGSYFESDSLKQQVSSIKRGNIERIDSDSAVRTATKPVALTADDVTSLTEGIHENIDIWGD